MYVYVCVCVCVCVCIFLRILFGLSSKHCSERLTIGSSVVSFDNDDFEQRFRGSLSYILQPSWYLLGG